MDSIVDFFADKIVQPTTIATVGTTATFFKSDELTVEYGRQQACDDDVIVVTTRYKTLSDVINHSTVKSEGGRAMARSSVGETKKGVDCYKWRLSDSLCRDATSSGESAAVRFADDIVSLNFYRDGRRVSRPIQLNFTLPDPQLERAPRPRCVFLDLHGDEQLWSTTGCRTYVSSRDRGKVTCKCNHTTNFALLLVVDTSARQFQPEDVPHNCSQHFQASSFFVFFLPNC